MGLLLVWSVTGPRVVVSSTMLPRPSWSGSMRRISSVSFPCKRAVMSRVSLSVLPRVSRLSKIPSRLNLERTSRSPPSLDTSTLAPPTWAPACVPLSTLTSQDGPRTPLMLLKPGVTVWVSSLVEPRVNLVAKLDTPMTFPTSIVLDTEVQLVQTMIDGVNTLWKEDLELQKKH